MDLEEQIKRLTISLAVDSYPVLDSLHYLRDYNSYIENSFDLKKSAIKAELGSNDRSEPKALNMEILQNQLELKKFNNFSNLMRESLLIALCAFIENVITNACVIDGRKGDYEAYKKIQKRNQSKDSAIQIAQDFLISKGFHAINNISGWDFIKDIMKVRNCFVHSGGVATIYVKGISGNYDFVIENDKIVLGKDFIENYIDVLEVFSVEFARLVYPDEGFIKKYMDKLKMNKQSSK